MNSHSVILVLFKRILFSELKQKYIYLCRRGGGGGDLRTSRGAILSF